MITSISLIIELCILAFYNSANGGVVYIPNIFPLCFIAVNLLCILIDLSKSQKRKYMSIFLFAYIVRIVILLVDIYLKGIVYIPQSGADSEGFYRTMEMVAFGFNYNEISYPVLVGYFFRFFGISRMGAQYANVLMSILAMFAICDALELLNINQKNRKTALWVMALLPNYVCMNCILLRESIVSMFIAISVLFFVRWITKKAETNFLLALLAILAASIFHSGAIGVAVGEILCRFLYDRRTEKITIKPSNVVIGVILAFSLVFLYLNYGDVFFQKMTGTSSLSEIANQSTLGETSYAEYVGDSSSIGSMIIYTIPRIFFFLFSPLPWSWRGINDVIAFVFSSLFYFFAIYYSLKTLRSNEIESSRRLQITLLLIVAFCVIFVFAWGTANAGTALRHREKIAPLCIVLLAFNNWRIKFKVRRN